VPFVFWNDRSWRLIGLVVSVFYERSEDSEFEYEAFFRYAIVEWCGHERNLVKIRAQVLLKIS
jgi:hypothetical protein